MRHYNHEVVVGYPNQEIFHVNVVADHEIWAHDIREIIRKSYHDSIIIINIFPDVSDEVVANVNHIIHIP